jgi:DtxR family transcriptional regulator, Mn-dependent transcriptional regulator
MLMGKNGLTAQKNKGLSASLEDYLEAILNVADEEGMSRSKDIAATLGVARPSVTGALKLLNKKGLVNYKPYGYVTLTEIGEVQAAKVAKKHDIIESFFMDILGVGHSVAHPAACRAEHLLSPAIVSRMGNFADFVKKQGRKGENVMNILERFSKRKESKK